jgi:hypothetical protein
VEGAREKFLTTQTLRILQYFPVLKFPEMTHKYIKGIAA